MKKKNKNTVLYIIAIIFIAIIMILGTLLIIKNKKTDTPENTLTNQTSDYNVTYEDMIGAGGVGNDEENPDFYNIETELNEKIVDKFKEVNQEDFIKLLHNGESRTYTLDYIKTIYNIDYTEYDKYSCDYEQSYIEVMRIDEQIIYSSFLSCQWSE